MISANVLYMRISTVRGKKVESKTRTIDEIYDLPMTELTETELNTLVEYKAEQLAREEHFNAMQEAMVQHNEELRQIHLNMAQKHKSTLSKLTEIALNRYESES